MAITESISKEFQKQSQLVSRIVQLLCDNREERGPISPTRSAVIGEQKTAEDQPEHSQKGAH